jgi:hypothetical protein
VIHQRLRRFRRIAAVPVRLADPEADAPLAIRLARFDLAAADQRLAIIFANGKAGQPAAATSTNSATARSRRSSSISASSIRSS